MLLDPQAAETGAPVPPEMFGDDYYKVYGTPDLTVSLEIRMALVVFFTLSFAAATLVLQRGGVRFNTSSVGADFSWV
ncbi:MAG: hypothetical protein QW781_05165 [Methanothrix sp.]